jgi:hypothetical protein
MFAAAPHLIASFDWSFWGVWSLTSVLMVVGLIGAAVPMVPGPLVIFVAAVAHKLLRPETGVGWWCIVGIFVLMLVAYALDFASGAIGARKFGGSAWGVAGVLVGGIVGMFFGFLGLIIGPIVGAFAFEMAFARKEWKPAMKSTWGSVVGTGVGLALRVMVSLAMIAAFLADVWWARG